MRTRNPITTPLRGLAKLAALAGGFLLVAGHAAPLLACPFFFLAPVAALARRFLGASQKRADFLTLLLPLVLIAGGLGLACADWYARPGNRLRVAAVSAAACAVCLGARPGYRAGSSRRRRQDYGAWDERRHHWNQWEQWEEWERREREARRWRRAHEDWTRAERERRERAQGGPWEEPRRSRFSIEDERAYAALGLAPGAKFSAVKKAYHKLIARHHPDKVGHLGEAARRAAEEKAKALNAAYSHLEGRLGK